MILKLTIENFLVISFVIFLLYYKLNLNYRLRKAFKISLSKPIKIIDCAPCFSFWLSLAISWNPFLAIAVFLFNVIIDQND